MGLEASRVLGGTTQRTLCGWGPCRGHAAESAPSRLVAQRLFRSGDTVLRHRIRSGSHATRSIVAEKCSDRILPDGPYDLSGRRVTACDERRPGAFLQCIGSLNETEASFRC